MPAIPLVGHFSPQHRLGGEALHLAPMLFSRGLRQYDAGELGGPVSWGFSRTLSSLPGIPPGDGHLRFLRGKGCFLESKGWGVLLPVISVCSDPKLGDMHSSAWTLFCHFPVHLLSQPDFHCSESNRSQVVSSMESGLGSQRQLLF